MTSPVSPSPQQLRLQPEPPPPPERDSTPVDPERYWLENVYQGGVRQLTVRAVIAGMLIGAVMCLSNLYVILKTGWSLGVTLTACILAFAAFGALRGVGLLKQDFTTLENNAMGSVASAAGYMTGGGNMAAVPALLMLTGTLPPTGWLVAWFAVISALGVFAAIPIKRQLINIEQLPFPTGTATAQTLQALHGQDERSRGKARALGLAGLIGAVIAFWRDAKASWLVWNLPAKLSLPFTIGGKPAGAWTLSLDLSLLLVGAGALVSFKTAWSMLLGALLTYGVLAPEMVSRGVIPEVTYKAINGWALWTGASVLVSSGLLSFAFQWRSVAKSVKALAGLFGRKQNTEADPLADIECPPAWFPLGFLVLGPVVVALMAYLFQIPWWAGVVALPLSVVMGVIASRVTGETDTTPTKALGPVTQLLYGALLPGNLTANVMSANATGGVGLHSADLLTDLKSGWLLGANPRQQFIAQLFGVVAGAAVVVPAFNLLVPDASVLGTEEFPAPSSLVWAGVSKMLMSGMHALPVSARFGALCGLCLGVALVLLERWAPKKAKPFIPSASGLGISIVIPGASSISFFIGAAIAEVLRRKKAKLADALVLPVSSGFIAGESLMGIAVAMLKAFGVMPK
ncbi:oligopeptide transporter OPT family [Cystobacter fuscus]|uniref:Oligopeptide transporter OPT family n=1 Tax=Cystobacter fuscus TaxID=43 RepID=A0A250J0V6_9BACT|nr:OPT family oligopeptide transporter [Cystobacter fuscus]ATB37087.1 oligopeptide transporter OPT family [Cystobacter fuscus]